MAKLLNKLREDAEVYYHADLLEYQDSNSKQLMVSRAAIGRILTLGLIYQVDGEERYARRAKEELMNVASFPDWKPSQFLSVAEMSVAVAFGYDWLYNELSAQERAELRQALLDKALVYGPAAYGDISQRKVANWSAVADRDTAINNWNPVCNGGLLAAALVLQEQTPELSAVVYKGVTETLPRTLEYYGPDGVWPESPTYWGYGTSYVVLCLALMQDQLGSDNGLSALPGIAETADYTRYIFGPTGVAFTYGDGGPARDVILGSSPSVAWLIQHFDQSSSVPLFRKRLSRFLDTKLSGYFASLTPGAAHRFTPLATLWLPEASEAYSDDSSPLNIHHDGFSELVFLRSRWNDPNGLWLAMKAGQNGFAHSHLDLGSFVLEADGVRWGEDLGSDSYGLKGYWDSKPDGMRWSYYRMNNLSHNTIGPGQTLQSVTATAPVIDFKSAPEMAYAVVDMTEVYPDAAERMRRGVAMLDNAYILIQDEWTAPSGHQPTVWRMMTRAAVALSADGRSATLTLQGKELMARILKPETAQFSIESATPSNPKEKQNNGLRVLTATVPPTTEDVQLAIVLIPGSSKSESTQVTALDLWADAFGGMDNAN
ncbi:heparinase II/III domain-containing protein [Cerasicoccus maritimus]|uniref:heparinase II/III domain-containing protein n=1 Tax=Cerasicoccus maritimus TaxID=490089 RepID=UPI002852DAF5|nr:heparinase II/III family protein [Cerasicoccus maritimus]